jgi:hypothetical protein
VVATATDGGDAEVGISDLYIAVEGTGSVLATALIGADADNDSSAEVLIGGNVAVSAVGNNADADIFVEALGIGKVDIGDSTASATATTGNASAIQEIAAGDSSSIAAGSVVATADGDDHAFATGVVAASSEGTVTASNLTATADATMSSATAVVSASGSSAATVDTVNVSAVAGPSAADAAGRVLGLDGGVAHVGGLSVTATSAATARAVGGLEASGGGSVTAGDVEWKAMSGADRGIAQADGRVVSNGGQVTVGEVTVTADAPGTSAFGMVTALGGLAAEIEAGNIGVRATGIGGATATGSIHSGDLTVVTAGDLMVSASATEAPGTVNAFGIVSASGGTLDAGHVAVIANGEAGIASGSATGQGTGVLIFDSLTVTATGADAFGKIAPEGSSSVTVGSAAVAATGSDGPSGLLVSSRQVSEVSVGNLSVNGTGAAGDVGVQIAAHNASSIDVGNVSLTLDHASGFVDVFADDNLTAETIDDATVSVGDIEVTVVGEGSEARISVQQFFPQLGSFEIHWASSAETVMGDVSASVGAGASVLVTLGNVNADLARLASFDGLGDVSMTLSEQTFGAIDVDALDGAFALGMNIEDLDAATLAGTPHTIINGFEGDTDNIVFNLDPADAADFRAIADQTTAQGLFNALSTALNGTVDYVFAVYSGADITGDGVAETNLGVLAYDVDGNGITSVLYMPGVTELSAADLNDPLA